MESENKDLLRLFNERGERLDKYRSTVDKLEAEVMRLRRLAAEASIMLEQIEPSSCITIKESDKIEFVRKALREASKGA